MNDGAMLWNAIKYRDPPTAILTGVPIFLASRGDKAAWCKRELTCEEEGGMKVLTNHVDMAGGKYEHKVVKGQRSASTATKAHKERHTNVIDVITCWSRNKHCESGNGRVLIDDRIKLKKDWESQGGIFVHHLDSVSTLRKLRHLGILMEEGGNDESRIKKAKIMKENQHGVIIVDDSS